MTTPAAPGHSTQPPGRPVPSRFVALDGVRGIAALMIVVLHGQTLMGTRLFEHGYLMVDLFFLMSGFVLSAGYGDRLAEGGRGGWFMRLRLIRLYPLAILGLTLGLMVDAVLVARGVHAPGNPSALMFVLSALFLPWLGGGLIAPFDGPTWSLQAEFWVNAVYGFVARRLTNRRLVLIIAAAALALAANVAVTGAFDGGFANNDPGRHAGPFNVLVGWARMAFSFPLGILLHRLWRDGRLPALSANPPLLLIPAAIFAIAFAPPLPTAAYDLAVVWLAFPLLLVFAAQAQPTGRTARTYGLLGRLSYGLYTLHGPVIVLLQALLPAGASPGLRLVFFLSGFAASLTLAAAAERWIDAPVRRWASGRQTWLTPVNLNLADTRSGV
jgi:peptidoglycan/LPS O-acetylase OafA/YrhL